VTEDEIKAVITEIASGKAERLHTDLAELNYKGNLMFIYCIKPSLRLESSEIYFAYETFCQV